MGYAQSQGLGTGGLNESGEGEIVGADNLRRTQGFAGHDDFVASTQQRDTGTAADPQPGYVHGGGEPDIPGGEQPAGLNEGVAGGKVEAGGADILALGRTLEDGDAVAVAGGVFLDEIGRASCRERV